MANKWEYKEVFSKGYMEDEYSGHYEVTNGDIVLCTIDDPEDVTESENTLQRVAKALNESGCKFYCHTTAEHALHIENMQLRSKYDDLKEKYAHLETKYDNILATEDGHESKTENVWQSGYATGHEAGCERAIKDAAERISDKLMVIVKKELGVKDEIKPSSGPCASKSAISYTKGEWYLQENADAYTNIVRCNNGKHETIFIASTPQSSLPEARANARLMAAAPDLLEALQEIIAITDRDHVAWIKAKAAIEKAKLNNPH